ncbi:DinB family protein [Paenibacillus whitsoniae]|uniref:DinB family protein n=1 Tax=Paenibacillus whitsoniae TaxID=2496558 RepID=A0A430J9Z9_9BACL|nr:DinB family protein [Paenibacillus whitsoniae]RTE07854.1 DinB family protein [Paenibacillus whitsoniae]
MSETKESLGRSVEPYRATSALLRERLAEIAPELLAWKPAPEKWSIQEIAAHLVDASFVHSIRLRKILAEPSEPYLLYAQDDWIASTHANDATLADSLDAFDAILAYNALVYGRLAEAQWARAAFHNGKDVSVDDLFQSFIRHVQTHLAQIQRNIDAWQATKSVG